MSSRDVSIREVTSERGGLLLGGAREKRSTVHFRDGLDIMQDAGGGGRLGKEEMDEVRRQMASIVEAQARIVEILNRVEGQ